MPHFNIGVWYNMKKNMDFILLYRTRSCIYSTLVCGHMEDYGINVQSMTIKSFNVDV